MRTTQFGTKAELASVNQNATQMTIEASALAHITKALTNLYSHPSLAVLREYTSNALDAHEKIRQVRPIEITLNYRELIIRDFGEGMSEADLRDIYSRYGASTKRLNNNAIGGFGFGCKSALAITSEFFINTVKDGVRTNAVVSRTGDDDPGSVDPVASDAAGEESGTTITIPLRQTTYHNEISQAIQSADFLMGFDKDSITVNGSPVRRSLNDGSFFSVGVDESTPYGWVPKVLIEKQNLARRYTRPPKLALVIGGVIYDYECPEISGPRYSFKNRPSYALPNKAAEDLFQRMTKFGDKIYLNIPIGVVDISPSRENVTVTEKSDKAVIAVLTDFLASAASTVQMEIDEINTYKDALNFYYANRHYLGIEVKSTYANPAKPDAEKWLYRGKHLPLHQLLGDKLGQKVMSDKGVAPSPTGNYVINSLDYAIASTEILVDESGYMRGSRATKHTIVFYDDYSKDDWEIIRKNIKDYTEKVFNQNTGTGYYIHSSADNSTVRDIFNVATAEEILEAARSLRRDRRAKPVTTTRAKLSYLVFDTQSVNNKASRIEATELDQSQLVILHDPFGSLGVSPMASVWDSEKNHKTDTGKVPLPEIFAGQLRSIFPGKKIILLPRNREAASTIKRFPNIIDGREFIGKSLLDVIDGKNGHKKSLVSALVGETPFFYTYGNGVRFANFLYQDRFPKPSLSNKLADELFNQVANFGLTYSLLQMSSFFRRNTSGFSEIPDLLKKIEKDYERDLANQGLRSFQDNLEVLTIHHGHTSTVTETRWRNIVAAMDALLS